MLDLQKYVKKDGNYIEIINYSDKGISKKALYHDGNSVEKIHLIHKNYQPYDDAYFYNGLAVIHLGKIENIKNWGVFKNVIPTNNYCVVNKNLDIVVDETELDSDGFSLKPSTVLKLVKQYGIGALQILNPKMLLVNDFETTLKEYFDMYCSKELNKIDHISKEKLDEEKKCFINLIDDLKDQLENDSTNMI